MIRSNWQRDKVDQRLHPQSLGDFSGQEEICKRLEILIGAAQKRQAPLPHALLHGPPGLGKTTLATIVATAMGSQLVTISAPTLDKAGDIAGILTNLEAGDVLFIDEIHRLSRPLEEYLYPAMERFCLDLVIDHGPNARTVQVQLHPFTLIGATTCLGMLSAPLRSRFGFIARLDYYSETTLYHIVTRSAKSLQLSIEPEAAKIIACCSRATPRTANHLLRWVRDFAQIQETQHITADLTTTALALLKIDAKGLNELDKRILMVLIEHHQGGPVGIETLAVALGEEAITLAEVHEPFLIQQGLLKRTPRGREATGLAYRYLGK